MKAIRKRFAYDVFLSHTSKDRPAVRELAERLKQDGLRVWFDEWVVQPGDSIPLKIEQGMEQSRTLILVMSQTAFTPEWVALERHTALFRDPTNAERRFIPLRLDDAEITDALKQFAYIDWRQKAPDQYARLLTACRPASAETRPTRKRQRRSPAVTVLKGHKDWVFSVVTTPDGRRAISGSGDATVRVWNLPPIAGEARQAGEATRYTNAKVLLVGDSGVGKSGLAYRLTEDRFVTTISTDAAWATQLPLPHDTGDDDIEREIWLWDFAGQADYRLIHQLYMDETALAVLVFNPQSENPFEGLGQWDHDLMRAARRPFQKLLVAGRCDRGGLMVSRESIERFRRERGCTAYLETSAYTGAGCQELRETIVHSIPWTGIAWTSSPRIFKVLKDAIVKLKDEGKVLLRIAELKQQLDMRLPGEQFSLDELRAVVGLLAGPGVVWQLDFGDFVLLQPERINAYAAAVIRSVRARMDKIGCISEERVLAGDLDYQDMQRLPLAEEEIILRAMHQTFVDYGLCLRERTDGGTLLVFPSYFRRARPELEDYPADTSTAKLKQGCRRTGLVRSLSDKGLKTMDETTYHTWWALHLRTTRGEHLNSEEQATYEAGLRQLQQEETGDQDILALQQTRTTVAALEAEQARLHARHEQLNAEIAALEAALSERTR